jgi:hypothetical protein
MSEQSTKLKLWWIPQIPMEAFEVEVSSIEEGAKLLNVLADYDAFQFEKNIKPDYCNVGGIVMLDSDGDWVDWWDEETGTDDPREYVCAALASREG